MTIKLTPPGAMALAIPLEAVMIDNELPINLINLYFLKAFL